VSEAGVRLPATVDVGLDELLLPRFLLDTCATVDEARVAIQQQTYGYRALPCHFVIVDRSGACLVFERTLSDDSSVFVEGRGVTAITNHLLHRGTPAIATESHVRCQALASAARAAVAWKEILGVNREFFVSPENHEFFGLTERVRTLWHSVYDTTDLSVDISFYLGDEQCGMGAGQPAYSPYLRQRLT
jgi:hypothetical protein